ncbi:hypothetical protein LVD13_01230 [Flavobacteriaceae bacterium D16]|nr:hypothetical protein [Flavobacteriaceae bacterium D16]
MKKLRLVALLSIPLLLFSCGATMKHTWSKEGFSGKKFEKILVIGASRNLASRTTFENTTVQRLAENGIKAENSLSVIPPVQDLNEISEERIVKAVKDGGYDGVIVASLLDINTKDVVQSGTPVYGPMYAGRGYYGYGYGRYVYRSYNYMYTPDYYREQKTFVVETRLFDANAESVEQALVWSGQSNITDPSSFETGAASYAKTLVKSLLKYKVVL